MSQRYLDEFESLQDVPRTFALEYVGKVDESALSQALRALFYNHPVLCGKIERTSRGKLLRTFLSHDVKIKSINGDKDTLWQFANSDWDSGRAVAELAHIHKVGFGYIALRITHAIVDGAAFIAYLTELLEHYTNIVHGVNTRVKTNPVLPRPPSDLIRERWDSSHERWESSQSSESLAEYTTNSGTSGVVFSCLKFTSGETSSIVQWARLNNLTVNSVVGSAVALGLRRLRSSGSASLPVTIFYPVNLRRRVSPAVQPTESTNFIGLSSAAFEISCNSTVHSVARDFRDQIQTNLANRRVAVSAREALTSLSSEAPGDSLGLVIHLSGQGILPELQHPNELRYVDLLRPPPDRMRTGGDGGYVTYTFQGRLAIDLRLSDDVFCDAESRLLRAYIKDEIDHATTS